MQQCSETDAYKHLLSIAQNLLYSLQIDQQMLTKYQSLKQAILDRISPNLNYTARLLNAYKQIMKNTLKVLGGWQSELENQMQRNNYNELVLSIGRQVGEIITDLTQFSNTIKSNPKLQLQFQEQIETYRYMYDQLDNKFENMGLTIEVHQKMHQIICEAGRNETNRISKQQQYRSKIKNLTHEHKSIISAKQFLKQHEITVQNLNKYNTAKKELTAILFNQ